MRKSYFIILFSILCTLCTHLSAAENKCSPSVGDQNVSRYLSGECVPAADVGLGGFYIVPANPDAGNRSAKSTLLRSSPLQNQVGPWLPTGLRVVGRAANAEGDRGKLKVYIQGEWGPWGAIPKEQKCPRTNCDCILEPCKPNQTGEDICLPNGQKVSDSRQDNRVPCLLRDGVGLYGLISLDGSDPNDPSFAGSTPPSSFRTFHMRATGKDQNGSYFILNGTKYCDKEGRCTADANIAQGGVYVKIVDKYYGDNYGYYSVLFVDGITAGRGFIQDAIELVEKVTMQVTKNLYNGILKNGFVDIARVILLLYVVLNTLLFSLGLIKTSQSELAVRVFKIGIIATLISPMSYEFFYGNLFSLFNEGSKNLASIVMRSTILQNTNNFPMMVSADANVLTLMDSILRVIVSGVIWKKAAALLFTSQYWFFFFGIALGLFCMMIAIIKSVVLYVVAVFVMALLLALAPFFILMVLFKVTGSIFDDWLKQLISAGLTIIIITMVMLLMIVIIGEQIYAMLRFSVCWDVWMDWGWFGSFKWYIIKDDISKTMTTARFCGYMVNILLFYNVIGYIPVLVDSLSAAARRPISEAFNIAEHRLNGLYQRYVAQNLGEYLSALPYREYRSIDFAIEKATRGKKGIRGEGYKPIKRLLKAFDWVDEKTDKFDQELRKKFGQTTSITGIEEMEQEQLHAQQEGKEIGLYNAPIFGSETIKKELHKKTFNIFND